MPAPPAAGGCTAVSPPCRNGCGQAAARCYFLSGSPATVLPQLAERCGAESLYYCRRYEPAARTQETALEAALGASVELRAFDDAYLNPHETIMTGSGTPFRVFTPYWKSASAGPETASPKPAPANPSFAKYDGEAPSLSDLKLLPRHPDWAGGLRATWTPGEDGALQRLDALETTIRDYAAERDRPDIDSTSRLSPHLHFGEISVRQVVNAIRNAGESPGAAALHRQLYWRDFSAYLLFHFPALPETPLRAEFEHFPCTGSEDDLEAWQRGMTGYPIVDAGMRQLWHSGWMHNRVRMIVASFLNQASADTLATRRRLVSRYAGRRRSRQQLRQLAVGGRLRHRCRAVLPHLQPDAAGKEIRPGGPLRTTLGSGACRHADEVHS